MRTDRYEFANACRGIAALAVVVVHLGISFWVNQPGIAVFTGLPPLTFDVPFFATWLDAIPVNLAAFGVALFFLVSGFVIPISLERYDAPAFLAARLLRIWPTYWVGFSITLAALATGAALFGGERPFNLVQALVHYFPPLRPLVNSKPLDGIVWTLEIEFFWYALAALLAPALRRGAHAAFLAPVALFALFCAAWAVTETAPAAWAKMTERLNFVVVYTPFLIFIFCGVALNFRQRELIGRPACAALVVLCLALFLGAVASGRLAGVAEPGSYLLALAVFIGAQRLPASVCSAGLLRFLARISYPLYVVHGFAGFVLLHGLVVAGWTPLAALIATIAAAIGLAWAVHRLVETPSHQAAQRLSRYLTRRDHRRKSTYS